MKGLNTHTDVIVQMVTNMRELLTFSLCVILCRFTLGSGMTTESPISTPQLSAVL